VKTQTCHHPDHVGSRELPVSEFREKRRSPGGRDATCSACRRHQERLQTRAYREACLDRYGRVCACPGCGETEDLNIDHVDGNSPVPHLASTRLYNWLVNNGFPDGFQVLCAACNRSKHNTGACRRDHGNAAGGTGNGAGSGRISLWEPPAGYWTAGPRSRGKVILAAWLDRQGLPAPSRAPYNGGRPRAARST
jgi:hypothetical protein